ncbi:MAG TPA: hypothetical protein VK666_17695 [Chryseolinea sp.]|nr:hypothetical protein [Chryseolinea sp.]
MPEPVKFRSGETSSELLIKYSGIYYISSLDNYVAIENDGHRLFSKTQGRRQELLSITDNKFVIKGIEDIVYEFKTDQHGNLVLTIDGLRPLDYRKLN